MHLIALARSGICVAVFALYDAVFVGTGGYSVVRSYACPQATTLIDRVFQILRLVMSS